MICHKCKSRATGRIGLNQFYCWDCNIEFVSTKDGVRMYRLEDDGTAILDSLEHSQLINALPDVQDDENTVGRNGS